MQQEASVGNEHRPFVSDVQALRQRAREHMQRGAVTSAYSADVATVIRILNEVLATELVCVLRYKRHYYMATGIHAQAVAEEFLEHAKEEQSHADLVAERITQLGGEPNFNPEGLAMRSHSQYVEGTSLLDMVREDLVAERIAVDSYTEIIRYLGNDDPTTRRMIETISAKEEEHADDMKKILETLGKDEKARQVKMRGIRKLPMSELSKLFKDSATQLGLFYPKHYLIAVFRDLEGAERVCRGLRDAGFAKEDAFTFPGRELIDLEKDETGLGSFLMQGLSRFFATEQVTTDEDLEKADHGAAFVAAYCPHEKAKQEARRVVEAGAPLAARYYGGDGIEHLAGDLVTN